MAQLQASVLSHPLDWLSVVLLVIGAGFWLKAALSTIRDGDKRSAGSVFIEGIDIHFTLREQARWIRNAAFVTAAAVAVQAVALILPLFGL